MLQQPKIPLGDIFTLAIVNVFLTQEEIIMKCICNPYDFFLKGSAFKHYTEQRLIFEYGPEVEYNPINPFSHHRLEQD